MANKRWRHDFGTEKQLLVFEPFYDENIVGELFKVEDGYWCYSSKLLDEEDVYLCNRDICEHDAKLKLEEIVFEHYKSERDYYQYMMNMFSE